jgi:hypothetical protein
MAAVGVFSVTPDLQLEFERLPSNLRERFNFLLIDRDNIGDELEFSHSYQIKLDQVDELPNGYTKHFIPNIKRDDFVRALSILFEGGKYSVGPGKTYPEQSTTGFLGATFVKSLSKRQLADRVRHVCQGPCPPNCRQTGCKCNRGLARCV